MLSEIHTVSLPFHLYLQRTIKFSDSATHLFWYSFISNITSGTPHRVTEVTFRRRLFLVMIRLSLGVEMDRRKERRLNLELPVRIWGVDRLARPFAEIVRVRNVSNGGAVLIGVRSKLHTGEVVDVQLGASRAEFRVVWMSLSGEAGIQALANETPVFSMTGTIGLPKVFEMVGTG